MNARIVTGFSLAAAAACVPQLSLTDAPCDGTACVDGFACCDGACVPADEPCLGDCLAPGDGSAAERFMPFVTGSVWTYDVTNASTKAFDSTKKLRLGSAEELAPWGESAAHRLCREDRNGDDNADSGAVRWEEDLGDAAVWRRNLRFDSDGATQDELPEPFALRVDESADRLCEGARYRADYTERVIDPRTCAEHSLADPTACDGEIVEVSEEWTVDAVDFPVEVSDIGELLTLQVTRTSRSADVTEVATFWFARGIGKVRELDPNEEAEELRYYSIPGVGAGGADIGAPMDPCDSEWTPRF